MREIEFRAYGPNCDVMWGWDEVKRIANSVGWENFTEGERVLMQYTGVNLAGGVKLFDGDIIKFDWVYQKDGSPYVENSIGMIGTVKWNGRFVVNFGGLSFDLHEINQGTFERFWKEDYHSAKTEYFKMVNFGLLGNIHQHPHLLEQSQ